MYETNERELFFHVLFDLQLFAESGEGSSSTGDGGSAGVSAPDNGGAPSEPATEASGGEDITEIKRRHNLMSPKDAEKRYKTQIGKAGRMDKYDGVLGELAARYGVTPGDDDALIKAIHDDRSHIKALARENGWSEEAAERVVKAEAENAAYELQEQARQQAVRDQQIEREEADMRAAYSDFDLAAEMKNERFGKLLDAGFTMREAYEAVHGTELARKLVERAVAETVEKYAGKAAGSARPPEGASQGSAGSVTVNDFSKMSDEELAAWMATHSPY